MPIPERTLSLDEEVIDVTFRVSTLPDVCEVLVNGCHYASAHRSLASDEGLKGLHEAHAVALEAQYGGWTVREMNQALARIQAVK